MPGLIGCALGLAALACAGDEPAGPPPPPTAIQFRALTAGYYHTCALGLTGHAYCWGWNDFGTLGDGTRTQRDRPTPVLGSTAFTTLDAGAGHNCALTGAGQAWCWGHNDEGQLGDGTFQGRDRPTAVAPAPAFTAISAGHAHTCALRADGSAYCWGDDIRGQLGDGPRGASTKSPVPVLVQTSSRFTAIVAGWYQSCALTADGKAWCWGANDSGQVGDGTTVDRDVPVAVLTDQTFTSLSAGDRFVCGVSDGRVWCWGANRRGELGENGGTGSNTPVAVPAAGAVQAVAAGTGAVTIPFAAPYACALTTGGTARCWGGAVPGLRAAGPQPTALEPPISATALALGPRHVCLLDRRGYAWCGGANDTGQLGDGTTLDRLLLTGVRGP